MARIIRFTLDDVVREYDMGSFRLSEADELKRLTGWSRSEWIEQLFNDHPDAIRYAWMIANKRADTPLAEKFADIDFDLAAMGIDIVDPDEPEAAVDGAEGSEVPTGPPAE